MRNSFKRCLSARNRSNIANATTSNGHPPNLFISFGMTTFIGKVMVANKIATTIFAKIFLFTIARVAIFLYVLSLAARTFQSYLHFHTFNNTLFSLLFCWLFFYSTLFRTPPNNEIKLPTIFKLPIPVLKHPLLLANLTNAIKAMQSELKD